MQDHCQRWTRPNFQNILIVLGLLICQHWSVQAQPQGVCNSFRRQYDSCTTYTEDSSRNLCSWEGSSFLCGDCNQPFTGRYCCRRDTCQRLQHCSGSSQLENSCELEGDVYRCGEKRYKKCQWNNDDRTFCCSEPIKHIPCRHGWVKEYGCDVQGSAFHCGEKRYMECQWNNDDLSFCCSGLIKHVRCPRGYAKEYNCVLDGNVFLCGEKRYRECQWNDDDLTHCCRNRVRHG